MHSALSQVPPSRGKRQAHHPVIARPLVCRVCGNQQGLVLVLTLVFLAALTILGSTAVTMTSTDLLLGGNYKSSQVAFYQAEAGVHYTLARLPHLISQGTLSLDGSRETEDSIFDTPTGFTFHIAPLTTFTRVANTRKYVFQVTGRPRPNSSIQSKLEVVMQRQSAFPYGMFGDERVDLPTAGTFAARIGSNGVVSVPSRQAVITVEGDIALGADTAGDKAVFSFKHTAETINEAPTTVSVGAGKALDLTAVVRINPDPLDADTLVASASLQLSAINNNSSVAAIVSDSINQTTTLTPGDYYLTDIALGSGETLTIDASSGDVNVYAKSIDFTNDAQIIMDATGGGKITIYLDGEGSFGSPDVLPRPTLTMTGPPANFRIFSRSNEPIHFSHHGDLKGLVYAPFASVTCSNTSARASGLLWAKVIVMQAAPGPFVFDVDPALPDAFLSNTVTLISWKETWD